MITHQRCDQACAQETLHGCEGPPWGSPCSDMHPAFPTINLSYRSTAVGESSMHARLNHGTHHAWNMHTQWVAGTCVSLRYACHQFRWHIVSLSYTSGAVGESSIHARHNQYGYQASTPFDDRRSTTPAFRHICDTLNFGLHPRFKKHLQS